MDLRGFVQICAWGAAETGRTWQRPVGKINIFPTESDG
jgi:hypothetical protein